METKEYYQSLMAVIEYVAAGHKEISRAKGEELAGNYWARIYRLFKEECIGVPISGGDFDITQGQYLNPIYEDCIHALEEIKKHEADRNLDNAVKLSNIKYAKSAYRISIISIAVAAIALAWQIIIQIVK